MDNYQSYTWQDSTVYLNHVIVRVNDGYTLIGESPYAHYLYRFTTIEQAKKTIDALYVTDLVHELLAAAEKRDLISPQQKEDLSNLLYDEFEKDAADLQKVIQKYSFFQRLNVS